MWLHVDEAVEQLQYGSECMIVESSLRAWVDDRVALTVLEWVLVWYLRYLVQVEFKLVFHTITNEDPFFVCSCHTIKFCLLKLRS